MQRRLACLALVAVLLATVATPTGAQSPPSNFATVINVPSDPAPAVVGSNTQLNIYPDASLSGLQAGNPWNSKNIEINFYGGWGGEITGDRGVEVNVLGGVIGSGAARSGSVFNVLGGSLNYFTAESGSQVNINSGIVGDRFTAESGSHVKIAGGVFEEDFDASGDGVQIHGGEFRLNGNLISGLSTVGRQVSVTPGATFVLSGTLADGTPFSFSSYDNEDVRTSTDNLNDSFAGSVTLVREELPAVGPAAVNVPEMPIPTGVRAGQTLTVSDGAVVPRNFNAGYGSSVVVQGGRVDDNFEATWATVRIEGGVVNRDFDAIGSNVTITGGVVGNSFEAMRGSQVNISGGHLGSLTTGSDTTVTMSGGVVNDLWAKSGSTLMLSGGSYNDLTIGPGAAMVASGGAFGDSPAAFTGGSFTLAGDDFRVDGEPVSGFTAIGQSQPIEFLQGQLLTGVLADGTPFAFQNEDDHDTFYAGTVRLKLAETPAVGPALVLASSGGVGYGIREGQTLVVDSGGVVPSNFNAGRGTTVVIEEGGTVGDNFEAVGSNVTITGGTVGRSFDAFAGTTVHVTGGKIASFFEALPGSTVVVDGGTFDRFFELNRDSNVTINGGEFGGLDIGSSYHPAGNDAVVYGGTFGAIRMRSSGSLLVHGGAFGEIATAGGSVLTLYGGEFQLDGVPVTGLDQVGNSVVFDLPNGALLTGVLSDGTPLAFSTLDTDVIRDGTLRLERAAIPVAEPGVIDAGTDGTPHGVRAGQTLVVSSGAEVGDNFNAAPGSVTRVKDGGAIGANFEVVGGEVFVEGGVIGPDFDVFRGSEVFVTSGTVTDLVNHAGSVVRVTGGQIGGRTAGTFHVAGGEVMPNFIVGAGGVMNIAGGTIGSGLKVDSDGAVKITGGAIGDNFGANYGSEVNVSGGAFGEAFRADGGSEVNLIGTEFFLNGESLGVLVPGEAYMITERDVALTGVLADGSPIEFDLNATGDFSVDVFSTWATLTVTLLPLPGDFDGDGSVDLADLDVWRSNYGLEVIPFNGADGNGDGVVDAADYTVWRDNLESEPASVPEPVGLTTVAIALLLAARRRRRRH